MARSSFRNHRGRYHLLKDLAEELPQAHLPLLGFTQITTGFLVAVKGGTLMQFAARKFQTGDTIFREGSTGNAAYILKEGSVEIAVAAEGKKTVLAVLKPVNVFGEMALLLDDHKRVATATALENTEVVEVSKVNFDKFIESSPALIKTLLTVFAERLRHADTRIMRIPDLFAVTCEILNLLFEHGQTEIRYDPTLSAIARSLSLDQTVIREQLERIEQLNLIKIQKNTRGEKTICSSGDHFLRRAVQIREALSNFTPEKIS